MAASPSHFGTERLSRAWFPVFMEGGLFACGDCHSTQGDGELYGTGIESLMTVTLRFNLRKDLDIQELQFITSSLLTQLDTHGFYATTAHGPDLMENTKYATRYMIDWWVRTQGFSRSPTYILCDQVVDLKISAIVDVPNFMVSAYLPLLILNA
jgi:acetamidase/formamidase